MSTPWKILIADDNEDIHAITKMALRDYRFQGAPLQFFSAYSAQETIDTLREKEDIAVLILDVIMETPHAGLDIVHSIRHALGRTDLRILLRTGQPDHFVEDQVMENYDINDFLDKTEMTSVKLRSALHAAIRGYQGFKALGRSSRIFQTLAEFPSRLAPLETRKGLAEEAVQMGKEIMGFFPEVTCRFELDPSENPRSLWFKTLHLPGEQNLVFSLIADGKGPVPALPQLLLQTLSLWGHQIGSAMDNLVLIQELKHQALELQTSLMEKNTLLKEIHHRVKNNLQILISLLKVQEDHQSLNDILNRIQSMALIHEHLYQSKSLSQVELGQYLRQLIENFQDSQDAPGSLHLTLPPDPVWLTLDEILPCGLLTNELLTNAWKYAKPQKKGSPIQIILREENGVSLTVSDPGPAAKTRKKAPSSTGSGLGLELASLLAQQLKGKLTTTHEKGTTVTLQFDPKGAKL